MMQPRVSAGHHTPHHTVINCLRYASPEEISELKPLANLDHK
jgi:hypothetical protein